MIDDLDSPVPVLPRLPGILQEDEFLGRWLEAFDLSLAPVFAVLDNLDAYVRPETAPPDFLEWLAGWVEARLDDAWPLEQARHVVAEAAGLLRRTGTAGGIRDAMRVSAGPGSRVQVDDTGGATYSTEPRAALPGRSPAEVHIAVTVPGGDPAEQQRRLERAARQFVPAHVRCVITVSVDASENGPV
jgi:phage tail-like protein